MPAGRERVRGAAVSGKAEAGRGGKAVARGGVKRGYATAKKTAPAKGAIAGKVKLRILAPTRYPWRFNGPRRSRHAIDRRRFVPFNYLHPRVEGVTVFEPSLLPGPRRRHDLVHAFNRIPLGRTPFVIGFESHLPRAFGWERSLWFRGLSAMLRSDRCRAVVAISHFARTTFLRQHEGAPAATRAALRRKLTVRLPSLPVAERPAPLPEGEAIRLVFVGAHFARKGGLVALRAMSLARARGLAVELDIVSDLTVGRASWTDPVDPAYYEPFWRDLAMPGVRHHGALDNAAVLDLVGRAHFLLLPTFGDTFGYSVIEAMARGVPTIVTDQGALPEFVRDAGAGGDGGNGIVLPLPTRHGEWIHMNDADRGSARFERIHRDAVEALAEAMVERLEALAGDRARLVAMRATALEDARTLFDPEDTSHYWDALYERAMRGPVTVAPPMTTPLPLAEPAKEPL